MGMRAALKLVLLLAAVMPMATFAEAQNAPPPQAPAAPPAVEEPPAPQADKPAPGDNAFPEEQSRAAEKAANGAENAADAGPADDGADRTVPASSSRSRIKGIDVLGDRDDRTANGAGGTIENPELAKQDVRVGQLYMADANYQGAYGRFKEATIVGPGNPDAVFYLAEAARKTAHLDEAATNYKLYLDAEPRGKHSKDARKALVELAGK